ncbi:MAG: hypothetical protein IPP81_13625 [Chitinophagaceae bacterium]|nr:hypothetical protein [Chitinophagaceae bacterium]
MVFIGDAATGFEVVELNPKAGLHKKVPVEIGPVAPVEQFVNCPTSAADSARLYKPIRSCLSLAKKLNYLRQQVAADK